MEQELFVKIAKMKCKVIEIPHSYKMRIYGVSKTREFRQGFKDLLWIIFFCLHQLVFSSNNTAKACAILKSLQFDGPLMSIIVTSYTSERIEDIFELLDSIITQTYPNFEIVFVVEGSKELEMKVRAYQEKNKISTMKVVFYSERLGLSAARNLGSEKAKGDIFAFVDDDVILFPHWAEEVVKTFMDDSIVGVTGPALLYWKDKPLEWFPEEFHWLIGGTSWYDERGLNDVRNVWGMNMSFRKQAFASTNGFKTNFGLHNISRTNWRDPPSEDVDFSFRVRKETCKRIVYNPNVRVGHKVSNSKITFLFIMQRAFSVGYQRRMIKRMYIWSNSTKDIFSPERNVVSRIFTNLLPSILTGFFKAPLVALRKAAVTCIIMMFVGLGYFTFG